MSHGYSSRYVEEQEYSESECPSDGQMLPQTTSDVTELYRRKQAALNSVGNYYYPYMQGYYDPQSRHPASACNCNMPPDPRYCYYKVPTSQNQEVLRQPQRRSSHDPKTPSAPVKKYPVTARTPRYYRCPTAPLCKRPSTLCLPVTCQQDPATCPRPRKGAPEIHHYHGQQEGNYDYAMRSSKKAEVRPVDSEGDVNSRLNDLENLLTKFDVDDDEGENEAVEICGVSDLSKILKPKVPSSVKSKQEKICKLKVVKAPNDMNPPSCAIGKLEVKEATPEESLDVLLQQYGKEDGDKPKPNELTTVDIRSRHQHQPKPPLDDNSALELHRSKSFIVSLIDKALSKELGTIPGDKCTRKEFLTMNPKRAIDLVNRHASPKPSGSAGNRTTCLPVVPMSPAGTSKKEDGCECSKNAGHTEEPLYLKQLKQLRWSHLRHIQREAKRLADLERFLDSFGDIENSSP